MNDPQLTTNKQHIHTYMTQIPPCLMSNCPTISRMNLRSHHRLFHMNGGSFDLSNWAQLSTTRRQSVFTVAASTVGQRGYGITQAAVATWSIQALFFYNFNLLAALQNKCQRNSNEWLSSGLSVEESWGWLTVIWAQFAEALDVGDFLCCNNGYALSKDCASKCARGLDCGWSTVRWFVHATTYPRPTACCKNYVNK